MSQVKEIILKYLEEEHPDLRKLADTYCDIRELPSGSSYKVVVGREWDNEDLHNNKAITVGHIDLILFLWKRYENR